MGRKSAGSVVLAGVRAGGVEQKKCRLHWIRGYGCPLGKTVRASRQPTATLDLCRPLRFLKRVCCTQKCSSWVGGGVGGQLPETRRLTGTRGV